MKEYFKKSDWTDSTTTTTTTTSGIDASGLEPGVSQQLLQPAKHMASLFAFLQKFFGLVDYARVRRHYTRELETYFWNYIINANRFTAAAGVQVCRDVEALGAGKRLLQAARVLALPAAPGASAATDGDVSASALQSAIADTDFERLEAIKLQLDIDLTFEDIRRLLGRRADLA